VHRTQPVQRSLGSLEVADSGAGRPGRSWRTRSATRRPADPLAAGTRARTPWSPRCSQRGMRVRRAETASVPASHSSSTRRSSRTPPPTLMDVDQATGAVKVTRIIVAHECGLIVNLDGLRNQIEGNVVQGISRTFKEQVAYGPVSAAVLGLALQRGDQDRDHSHRPVRSAGVRRRRTHHRHHRRRHRQRDIRGDRQAHSQPADDRGTGHSDARHLRHR
jgi:hypothetical protein